MLALPAEPGGGRERLFHHGRGVDEDLDVAARARRDLAGEFLQLALDDVMIVAIAGIDGDRADLPALQERERVFVGTVVHGEHDDAAHVGPQRLRRRAPLERLGQPVHVAVMLGRAALRRGARPPAGSRRAASPRRRRSPVARPPAR